MSFNRSLFKQTIVYTQQNTTQKKKKGVNYDIYNNLNRTQGYHAEWKSQSQNVTYCMILNNLPEITKLETENWISGCQG